MDHIEMAERLENATVRVDKMIFIPGAVIAGSASADLEGMLDDLYHSNAQILKTLPALNNLVDELLHDKSADIGDLAAEYLMNVEGFFVQLATPLPRNMESETMYTFSWAIYNTEWVYVRTMDELVMAAEAFNERVIQREYKKSLTEKVD